MLHSIVKCPKPLLQVGDSENASFLAKGLLRNMSADEIVDMMKGVKLVCAAGIIYPHKAASAWVDAIVAQFDADVMILTIYSPVL